jgi:phosphoribosylglycinamide formyltransferase-1
VPVKQIVIFASGSGSNAQAIIEHFAAHATVRVAALFSNKPNAYALERARQAGIPACTFSRDEFHNGTVLEQLQKIAPDLIVLAGFLWLVPEQLVQAYEHKIINIHPALLPEFGGKGMHGHHVHQAVIQNQEQQSGLTIHYVNPEYDKGNFILQAYCPVLPADTPETLAARVLRLEHFYLPRTIEQLLQQHQPAAGD